MQDNLQKKEKNGQTIEILGAPLIRIGGVPADDLVFASENIVEILDSIDNLGVESDLLASKLSDAIHSIVPHVSREERRVLLSARRLIHKGMVPEDKALEFLFSLLSDSDTFLLEQWLECREKYGELFDALRDAVGKHDKELKGRLISFLEKEDFLRGLSLASPSFTLNFSSEFSEEPTWRLLRSLYHYATRVCMKTSPFSNFTTVDLAGQEGQRDSVVHVASYIALAILHTFFRETGAAFDVAVEKSPIAFISCCGHDRLLLLPRNIYMNGIIYREETVVGANLLDPCFDFEKEEALTQRRLLEEGVVRLKIPWKRMDNPIAFLFAQLSSETSAIPEVLDKKDLGWISKLESSFSNKTGVERALEMDKLKILVEKFFPNKELGDKPSGFLYEDVSTGEPSYNPFNSPIVIADLEAFSDELSPWIQRSHAYDLMVERFVTRFGRGGATGDVLGFCMSLAMDGDGDDELMRAFYLDRFVSERMDKNNYKVGATAVPRNIGLMCQFVAPDSESVERGEYLLVVNSLGNGAGAYQARFHRLFGEKERIKLANEIKRMSGTERVLELTFWTDCNTGQMVCSGVLPELVLPGEVQSDLGISIDSLSLRHDITTNSLELFDEKGPISLVYLGITPQHLLNGYFLWLALLADPWTKFPPLSEAYVNQTCGTANVKSGQVIHSPRKVIGKRVVVKREDWILAAPTIRDLFSADSVESIRNWHSFCRQHGIPAEVFVHQGTYGGGTTSDKRKPQYVDFTSNVSLRIFESWLSDFSGTLRFTEVLPSCKQYHHRDRNGKRRVSEYAISTYWIDGEHDER